jgi:glycosyltransferase involved in cell wall biosynthesis
VSVSFITTHFHDVGWTERLIRQLRATTPHEAIAEILVVDQDRTPASAERLSALDRAVRVVQYPRSSRHFEWTRHDHAAVLNHAVTDARGELICLFDSDAHPISPAWWPRVMELLRSYDAVLARERGTDFSHPCFMAFAATQGPGLRFDQDLFTEQHRDTGRMIARQLRDRGQRVCLLAPEDAFGGRFGSVYLGCIYHHGKGVFAGVDDPLLQRQIGWEHRWYRARVLEDETYDLTRPRRLQLLSVRAGRRFLRAVLSRRGRSRGAGENRA